MSKFTFSRQLFKQQPNKRHYNEVINDFKSVVNGSQITAENLKDESISFRHLKGPTSILLYKDCADDIFRYGSGSTATNFSNTGRSAWSIYRTGDTDSLNTAKLWYTAPADLQAGEKVIDFTIEYYPYNAGPRTRIAPAFQAVGSSGWTALTQYAKKCGIIAGQSHPADVTPYAPNSDRYPKHPVLNGLSVPERSTGQPRTDKLHTGAIPQCVRINVQFGKSLTTDGGAVVNLSDIQAWGMAIFHESSDDRPRADYITYLSLGGVMDHYGFKASCSRFDHLNLIMVARRF